MPSVTTGTTANHGKFTCNEFQEIFVYEDWDGNVEALALGSDEVAGIELMDAGDVLAAWDEGNPAFVPRGPSYRRILGAVLGFFPIGGW